MYDLTKYVYVTDVMLDMRRTVDYERLVSRLDEVSPGLDTCGVQSIDSERRNGENMNSEQ